MAEEVRLNLPSPEQPSTEKPQPERQAQSGSQSRRQFFTAEQCLELLSQLCGLLILGSVRPNQGSVIRGVLRDILGYHERATGSTQGGPRVENSLLDSLRANPELMNLLAPFLTDDQIAQLMKPATDGSSEPQT